MAPHSTLLSDIMEEMDPRVLELIKSHITTFTRWDIIRFLHENPNTQDTAESLARYVGRDPQVIARETRELEMELILESELQGTRAVYRLAEDADLRERIATLVEAARDRTFRMKLVYHILRAGGQ